MLIAISDPTVNPTTNQNLSEIEIERSNGSIRAMEISWKALRF